MSIQITERITTEYIPLIRDSFTKGLAVVAFANTLSVSTPEESISDTIQEVKNNLPIGGLAFSSLGDFAELYDHYGDTQELDKVVDEVAQNVASDFAKWEDEINGKIKTDSPSPFVIINRKDADNAIALWQAHPSEDTEAATRHILHYAYYATPASVRQGWSESYMDAYERMVAAHKNFELSDGDGDKLTLSTALRQTAIARHSIKDQATFSFTIDQYDSNFRNND